MQTDDTVKTIHLIGAPIDSAGPSRGCSLAPAVLRLCGLQSTLEALSHRVKDDGDISLGTPDFDLRAPEHIRSPSESAGWVHSIQTALKEYEENAVPIAIGGDHLMAAGTIPVHALHAQKLHQPLFVVWLDAHTDYHTPYTSESGNLHGSPVAYFTGDEGFDAVLPPLPCAVSPEQVCMIGIRSVDPAERARIKRTGMDLIDIRRIDEEGIAKPFRQFLERAIAANARVHVSLDVDFLDPQIAPAVSTTVQGGATLREAHLVMEMLCDTGLVTSVDIAEYNPLLDDHSTTARLLIELMASLFGKRVIDRS